MYILPLTAFSKRHIDDLVKQTYCAFPQGVTDIEHEIPMYFIPEIKFNQHSMHYHHQFEVCLKRKAIIGSHAHDDESLKRKLKVMRQVFVVSDGVHKDVNTLLDLFTHI